MPETPAPPQRLRSRARRAAAPALIATIAIVAVLAIVHPLILRELVERRLRVSLGCRVHLRSATIAGSSKVVLHDARLRAPDTPGLGGVFLESRRVEAFVNWSELLAGRQGVTLLRLYEPVVRLSQGIDDGVLNIQRIGGGSMSGSPSLAPLPSVEFVGGVVEFGEHAAGAYTSLAAMNVSGAVTVPDRAVAEYVVNLIESRVDTDTPARVSGRFDLDRLVGSLEMTDLRLGLWRAWAAPSDARDLWRQMAIDGLVKGATFSVDETGEIAARFDLEDVDLTTPVPAPDPLQPNRLIRAQGVDGFIRFNSEGLTADLSGLVEDFPGRLTLSTRGLALDAPLEAKISTERFVLSERPSLLPFAPPVLQTLFQKFSSPTGEMEGSVRLTRGEPGEAGPAPVRMLGEISFRNARGAHEAFPYPFEGMSGLVRFDDEKVEVVEVLGTGPTGARLRATGVIAPPDDHAAVDLALRIERVPTDEVLRSAMPPDRRDFLSQVMDEDALRGIRESGLAISEADRADLARRLVEAQAALDELEDEPGGSARRAEVSRRIDSIRAALTTPVFDIGGTADVEVNITRPMGLGQPYSTRVAIHFEQAGLLPAVFPYPFRARNMNIVFDRDRASATADRIEGLSGAEGMLLAEFAFTGEGAEQQTHPRIVIDVPRGPIDDYLIRAVSTADFDGSGPTLQETLRRLRLSGEVSAHVEIGGRRDGRTQFLAQVAMLEARAEPEAPAPMTERPEHGARTLPIESMTGEIVVSDRGFALGPIRGLLGGSRTPIVLEGAWRRAAAGPDAPPSAFRALLEIERLDLSEPIEALIAAVAPEAAARTAERRAHHRIEGSARAVARAESVSGGDLATVASLTEIRALGFDAAGARFTAQEVAGEALFSVDGVKWEGVEGDFSVDGSPVGRLRLDGVAALDAQHATDMRLVSESAAISPTLVRAALAGDVPEGVEAWLDRAQPVIEASVEARVRSTEAGGLEWDALIRPRRGELITRDGTVQIAQVEGTIRIDPSGGRVEGVVGAGDGWSITADGSWKATEGTTALDLALGLEASGAPPALLAVFPAAVQEGAEALSVQVNGPWSVRDARLQWRDGALRFVGRAHFEDAACDPGVAVSRASGTAAIGVERARGAAQATTAVEFALDALELAGLSMTDARVRLRAGETPGRLIVEEWRAECSGGRVTGRATLDAAPSGEEEALWYETVMEMAGVRLGALLADAARARAGAESEDGAADRYAAYSGRIDARFAVAGRVGDDRTRRGRGSVRVVGGSIVDAPLLVPIIELSNLRVPSGESLDRAEAEMYLVGRRASFETLRIRSDSISMEGEGTVHWPDLELDLEFRSRATGRIPILSDILEGLRDEFATTTVTGTLREPKFGAEPFRGTRKVLDDVFGSGPDR